MYLAAETSRQALNQLTPFADKCPALRVPMRELADLLDSSLKDHDAQQRVCAAYHALRSAVWHLCSTLRGKPKKDPARRQLTRAIDCLPRLRWALENRAAHVYDDATVLRMYAPPESQPRPAA